MKRFLACLILLLPLTASAQAILYATQACGDCSPAPTGLYTIDPATGAGTLVGDTGESITGLDFHPDTGVLYGTTTPNSNTPSSLVIIDPTNGSVTVVGPHGIDRAITDLTFAPDGTLYGWMEPGSDSVVIIDVGTGAATVVADPSVGSGGCAFDMAPDGFLYLFGGYCQSPLNQDGDNAILKLDTATGLVVDYWPIATDAVWDCNIDADTGAWGAASHDAAGNLYGFSNAGCSNERPSRNLSTMDLATGTPAIVGASVDFASGIAFTPGSVVGEQGNAAPVPSMQKTGLMITVVLFALLGSLMAYRRKFV